MLQCFFFSLSQFCLLQTKAANANFVAFLGEAFKAMNDPSNDLASLLVTPVQRIPRYLMLVKSMLKHSYPAHPDYANLKTAEERISAIAVIVDQKAKDFENVQKMHHIDNILLEHDFVLLDPQRRFTHMGHVVWEKKQTKLFSVSKAPREMGLFLFSDLFVLAEPSADKKTYHFRRREMLLECEAQEEKGNAAAWRVVVEGSHEVTHVFTAKSEDERKVWLDHFVANIRDNNRKAATLKTVRDEQDKKKATTRTAASLSTSSVAPPMQTGGWRHIGVSPSEPTLPVSLARGTTPARTSNVMMRNSSSEPGSLAKAPQMGNRSSGEHKSPSPRPPLPQLPASGPASPRPTSPRTSMSSVQPPKSPTMATVPPVAPQRRVVTMGGASGNKAVAEWAAQGEKAATTAVAATTHVAAALPPPQVDMSEFGGVMKQDYTVLEPGGMSVRIGEVVTILDQNFSPGWLYVRNGAGLCGAVPAGHVELVDDEAAAAAVDVPPLPDFSLDDSGNVVSAHEADEAKRLPMQLPGAESSLDVVPSEMAAFLANSPEAPPAPIAAHAPPSVSLPPPSDEKQSGHTRKHSSLRGMFGLAEPASPGRKKSAKSSPVASPCASPETSPRVTSAKAMKMLGL